MRNAIKFILIVAATLAFLNQAHAQPAPGTTWVNQRGSVLTIDTIGIDGKFEGTFVNKAAGFKCQGMPYPVVGWIDGETMGWLVIWNNSYENCQSVTAWGGIVVSSSTIETNWVLSSLQTGSSLIGSDTFKMN